VGGAAAEIAKFEQDKEDARIAIENRAEMVTEYIPINYGNAEDIAKLLTDESKNSSTGGGSGGGGAGGQADRGFLSPRGSISFDQAHQHLLVIDIPARSCEIRAWCRCSTSRSTRC
jgi:type IV pilus assembly protein PilQ